MKLESSMHGPARTATITFTSKALEFLAVIMQKIGGDPYKIRGHAHRLAHILDGLGYDWGYLKTTEAFKVARAGDVIHFDD